MHSADEIRRYLHFSENYEPGVFAYSILDFPNSFGWKTIQLVFNARQEATTMQLDEHNWQVVAREDEIELSGIDCLLDKNVVVPPLSMMILVKND